MALIGEMKYLQIGSNTYKIPTGELPIASSSTLGGIKVGTNLSIDSSTGVLSVTGIPTKVSDLTNDAGYITGYTETDPTVPAWAKASSKPTYTASEVGAVPSSKSSGDHQTSITLTAQQLELLHDNDTDPTDRIILNDSGITLSVTSRAGENTITVTSDSTSIHNLVTPISDKDAANKLYVDNAISNISYPVISVNGQTGAVILPIPTISVTRNLTSGTKSATINISGTDYDIYSETIPTDISSFTNDAGYITSSDISGKVNKTGDTITGILIINSSGGRLQFYDSNADRDGTITMYASTRKDIMNNYEGYLSIDKHVACSATPSYDADLTNKSYVDNKVSSSVPSQASISSSGLITYSNSSGTSLFTLQLPLYDGGIS